MSANARRPRIMFYVQHLLGIGHLMRAGVLTRALETAGFDVTLVSGGIPVPNFVSGAGHFIQLPPTRAVDVYFKVLVDEHGRQIDDAWKALRRKMLLQTLDDCRPDILLIEMYPFGRRQMRFEIEPLIAHARAGRHAPIVVSSVRDILVQPDKPERIDEMVARVRDQFDLVLVHGDPDFVPFDETFPRLRDIADLIRYTGYVVGPAPLPEKESGPGSGEVIVSTGGGAVSEDMLAAVLEARALTRLADTTWRVLIGHNYPEADFQHYRDTVPAGIEIERARADFVQLLANSRLSISQGGYNTVMEILATHARAVCLPYAGGLESEQTLRCRLLAQRGVLQMVEKNEVSPQSIALAVEKALDSPEPANIGINTDGAACSAKLLRKAIE